MTTVPYRPHSTGVGHPSKCPCAPCVAAQAFNRKARLVGHTQTVDRAKLKAHIEYLQAETGLSLYRIAEAADLNVRVIHHFMSKDTARMFRRNAEKLLRVTPKQVRDHGKHPKEHFLWRTGVLQAHGYSMRRIAEVAGGRVIQGNDTRFNLNNVSPELWNRLDRAWKILSVRLADPVLDGIDATHIQSSKTIAAGKGFYPLAAYEKEFDKFPAALDNVTELVREDNEALYAAVETRIKAGMNRVEIRDELHRLYPDVESWEHVVARIQRRVRRAA